MDRFVFKKPRIQADNESAGESSTTSTSSACKGRQEASSNISINENDKKEDNSDEVKVPTPIQVNKTKNRKFLAQWAQTWSWLEYSNDKDCVFCHVCKEAYAKKLLDHTKFAKDAFINDGFCNWKKASERFTIHERSECHKTAAIKLTFVASGVNVASAVSKHHLMEMNTARKCLLKIVKSLAFLARQGLAIRGKTDECSNFNQLLLLQATDDHVLNEWLARSKYRWLSHDIQNEILQLLSDNVLRILCNKIRSQDFFAIMVDESTDCSRHEQMAMCLRYCNNELKTEEVFVGFYELDRQDASTLFAVVNDILLRFNLDIKKCRGQCYDGAANVAGHLNGLQAKIRDVEPRALFVHCFGHTLNLVVQDSMSAVANFRDSIHLFGNIVNFIRDSPKRLCCFEKFQAPDANALRPLCPTRWVLKQSTLSSVMDNYEELTNFLHEVTTTDKGESGAKAGGFCEKLGKFDTFFVLSALQRIFSAIGTISQTIQSSQLHLQRAQLMITDLLTVLKSYREDFNSFWEATVTRSKYFDIDDPQLPRVRRMPRRLDDGAAAHEFQTAEDYYRSQFYSVLDTAVAAIEQRFKAESLKFLESFESVLLKTGSSCAVLKDFYQDDFHDERLLLHIDMFHDIVKQQHENVTCLTDIVFQLQSNKLRMEMLTELTKAVRLFLTVPVTTCTAERSFSGLRRLKTYLRATMAQSRLNNIAILNCHSDVVLQLDFDAIVNEFIERNSVRRNAFAVVSL